MNLLNSNRRGWAWCESSMTQESAPQRRRSAAFVASLLLMAMAHLLTPTTSYGLQDWRMELIAEMGGVGARVETAFGLIEDVVIDDEGRVYVLDSRTQAVRIFDLSGRLLQTVGESGRENHQLFVPRALAVNSAGDLYVLDRGAGRLVVFQRSDGDSLVFAKTLRVPFMASDLCILNDEIMVLGVYDDLLIHRVDAIDGGVIQSFGRPFRDAHPLLRESLSRGQIACAGSINAIVVVSNLLPIVRAYTANGTLLWSRAITDYETLVIEEREDGSVYYRIPRSGRYNAAASLIPLASGDVILQIGTKTIDTGRRGVFADVSTQVWSVNEGTVRSNPPRLPRLGALRMPYAVAVNNAPIPTLRVYRVDAKAH